MPLKVLFDGKDLSPQVLTIRNGPQRFSYLDDFAPRLSHFPSNLKHDREHGATAARRVLYLW